MKWTMLHLDGSEWEVGDGIPWLPYVKAHLAEQIELWLEQV